MAVSHKAAFYNPEAREYLTSDKKNILVDYFFIYRIVDPLQFYNVLKDRRIAEITVDNMVNSILGSSLGHFELSRLINTEVGKTEIDCLTATVAENTAEALVDTGLRLETVCIKRLMFPRENEEAIFAPHVQRASENRQPVPQ